MVPSLVGLVVSLAILGFILYSTRRVRPLKTKLVLPVVLVVLGAGALIGSTQAKPMTPSEIGILVALLAGDAAGLGALRACTVRLWRQGESVFRQGTWLTVALWLAGLAVHEVVADVAHISSASLDLYLGLSLGSQLLVLRARARRPSQVAATPPAAVVRRPCHPAPASSRAPSPRQDQAR